MSNYTTLFSLPLTAYGFTSNWGQGYATKEEAVKFAKRYARLGGRRSAKVIDSDGNRVYSTQDAIPMTLTDDLYHIAEHIGDDQPNLPVGAKNTLLLAARRIDALTRWADAKRRLDQAIDSRSPDECDYWYDEIEAAEKELLEQLKEADDDDNA